MSDPRAMANDERQMSNEQFALCNRSIASIAHCSLLIAHLAFGVLAPALVIAAAPEIARAPVPKSPYIAVVYRFADTMLERGRDTYGAQKTGLFLSALDRSTLGPLTNRPPAPSGVREGDRVGGPAGPLVGANPQHDQNLFRLLHFLSELTTKPKYREAADAALGWFLENARSRPSDQLLWSEHVSWDVLADQPVSAGGDPVEAPGFFRPWLLWDRGFERAPEASRRFALSLGEPSSAVRAPSADAQGTRVKSVRQAGFHVRTWAVAYARTKDEQFLRSIEAVLRRLENDRNSQTGLIAADRSLTQVGTTSALSFAIDSDGAAHLVPASLAARLRDFAARVDESFCALPHDLPGTGGFIGTADPSTGRSIDPTTPRWQAGSGEPTTAQVGLMCASRYDNGGRIGHRHLLLAAADAYLDSRLPEADDLWPGTLGQVISLELAAWRHSARPVYLDRARSIADFAIERFFGSNALPRASLRSEHYESITGADTLVLALAELHLHVLHITAVRCPPNTVDR